MTTGKNRTDSNTYAMFYKYGMGSLFSQMVGLLKKLETKLAKSLQIGIIQFS